jgi:small subunit ribosomal protein S16
MLVIRLQRTGRKGQAMFRIVVQDSRRTPSSGKVVARLGSYDPHAKKVILDKEKASLFLKNGAQPSERMIGILTAEGIKLPSWVSKPNIKKKEVKNPAKRRSTAPAPEVVEEVAEQPAADTSKEQPIEESTEAETVEETEEESPTADQQPVA